MASALPLVGRGEIVDGGDTDTLQIEDERRMDLELQQRWVRTLLNAVVERMEPGGAGGDDGRAPRVPSRCRVPC